MNYRHAFHAGNFGDVLKHALLALVLRRMTRKPASVLFLDTHAGLGRYDLGADQALRTGEADRGVRRVWAAAHRPASLDPYIDVLRRLNPGGILARYPGSPELARRLLRPVDRLVLNELHPEDVVMLKRGFAGDARVTVRREDGFALVRALLPPPERRGVVLIDPAFEAADDLGRMVRTLVQGHRRFSTGVFLLWYPIKDAGPVAAFHAQLQGTGIRRILAAELLVRAADNAERLNGAGLVMVNPPWPLADEAGPLLDWLADALRDGPGAAARVVWVTPE